MSLRGKTIELCGTRYLVREVCASGSVFWALLQAPDGTLRTERLDHHVRVSDGQGQADNREESPSLTAAQAAEVAAESDPPWSSHPPRMARVVAEGRALDDAVAMSLDQHDYIQRARVVPGIKNANGAIPQPPAGEAWRDGFGVGWRRRAAADQGDALAAFDAVFAKLEEAGALAGTGTRKTRGAILQGIESLSRCAMTAESERQRLAYVLHEDLRVALKQPISASDADIVAAAHSAAGAAASVERIGAELDKAGAPAGLSVVDRVQRLLASWNSLREALKRAENAQAKNDTTLLDRVLDGAGVPDDVGLGPIATLGRVRLLIDERNKLREAAAAAASAESEGAAEAVADLRAIHARLVQHGAALPEGDLPASILAGIDSLAERAARTAPSSARADWWRGELLQALGVGDADAPRMNGALIDRVRELARQVDAVVVFRTEVVRALGWNPDATAPTDYDIARAVREQRIARKRAADTHRMLRARLCGVLRFPAADAVDDVLVQAVADQRAGLESARSELDLISKLCHGVDAPSVVECVRSLVADRTEHRLRCEELTRISAAHAEGVRLWRAERPRDASTLPPTRTELVAWLLGRISDLSAQLEGPKAEAARRDAADKELHRMLSTVEGGTVAEAVQSLLKSRAAIGEAYEEWVRTAFQHGIHNPGGLAAKLAGQRATIERLETSTVTVDVVFDGPPGSVGPRFVEVETIAGKGIDAGEWLKREDGRWVLRMRRPASPVEIKAFKDTEAVRLAAVQFRSDLVRALGWKPDVRYSEQEIIKGVIDRGRATAGRPMTEEEATAIAREAAFSTTPRPSYVQGDPASWMPHEWVIAAIRRAAGLGGVPQSLHPVIEAMERWVAARNRSGSGAVELGLAAVDAFEDWQLGIGSNKDG